jgi:hypothetical protein
LRLVAHLSVSCGKSFSYCANTRMLEAFQIGHNSIADNLVFPGECDSNPISPRTIGERYFLPTLERWTEASTFPRSAAHVRKPVDRGGRSLAIRSRSDGAFFHPNNRGQVRPPDFGTQRRLHRSSRRMVIGQPRFVNSDGLHRSPRGRLPWRNDPVLDVKEMLRLLPHLYICPDWI